VILIAVLVAATFGSTILAIESSKETHANNRVLADTAGGVLAVAEATASAPLYALLAMDIEQLSRVRSLTVSYAINGTLVQHQLTIVEREKRSKSVVLTSTLGSQIVLEGVTAILIKPGGETFRLCAASASCASFEVREPQPSNPNRSSHTHINIYVYIYICRYIYVYM